MSTASKSFVQFFESGDHSYSESLAIGGWTGATVLVEFCGDPDRRNPVSGHKQAIAHPRVQKPGFLFPPRVLTRRYGRNPVSCH
ncbi:MAG: hypothetical protein GDA48_12080 [Hormoscilla sp. GM102CHS1]|nr:hypothetical protein [Hormoscilla sp. GM102CHS1]